MRQVRILGTGCPKCRKLHERVEQAVREAGVEAEVKKVTDIGEIMEYGVMMTPALVVDGEVKLAGRVPPVEELKALIGGDER
ncbi:MAG: thioredoxin family protein [Planctomycetota bacterium]|nr:MAG: thioredoxin family protein [Planctomycetota bacterium]